MPSRPTDPPRHAQRGYSYVVMLLFVAVSAAALAALGRSWSTAAQRERERELEFRGQEIAQAIESYLAATPAGQPRRYPLSFDELLEDRRQLLIRHHLRRVYKDPFAPGGAWVLIAADGQPGFKGVHSEAQVPLLRHVSVQGERIERADQWTFVAQAGADAAARVPAR